MPDFWKDKMPNIVTLEENEALRAVQDTAELYGWRIPMIWTPSLVKHMFHSHFGREMTDQEWDIFASGDVWNSKIIMAGAMAENEVMLMALEDAFQSDDESDTASDMSNVYFINEETNMQEVFESIADDIFGDN